MISLYDWSKEAAKIIPLVLIVISISALCDGVDSQFHLNLQRRIQTARNNSCNDCKRILDLSIAEKRRLNILLNTIKDKLGIEPLNKQKDTNARPRESQYIQQKFSAPETSEIVSFPEKHDNTTKKNILIFTIDLRNNPGPLEAIKAHLWILVKQRRKTKKIGKRIWLRVLQVNDTNNTQHYLTSIRTRVKKTRWQKISLPVTLIQSMIDNEQHELKLKISCKKCGKIVRPVLHRKKRKRHLRERQKKNRKLKKANSRKSRRLKRTESVQPFLVISTRYRYKIIQ